ncbi:hypothetical protein BC829DRAFT_442092 [Chytridium lagenaria]|nr:hypothetical protein BC829DRAFT_442092 [Chytridium lagenaria]
MPLSSTSTDTVSMLDSMLSEEEDDEEDDGINDDEYEDDLQSDNDLTHTPTPTSSTVTTRQLLHLRILTAYLICLSLTLYFIPLHQLGLNSNPFATAGTVVWSCRLNHRGISLTVNTNGPTSLTYAILDSLKNTGAKATFFLVGEDVSSHPDLVHEMMNQGHTIGSHSWSYKNLSLLLDPSSVNYNPEALKTDILRTEEAIRNITGSRPYLFRPPFGAMTLELQDFLANMGYVMVMWNAGCIDTISPVAGVDAFMTGIPDAGAIVCIDVPYNETVMRSAENRIRTVISRSKDHGHPILDMKDCI